MVEAGGAAGAKARCGRKHPVVEKLRQAPTPPPHPPTESRCAPQGPHEYQRLNAKVQSAPCRSNIRDRNREQASEH